MMTPQTYKYLQLIRYNELSLWDIKRLFLTPIKSEYEIVKLNNVLTHRSEKIALYENPEQEYGILGVSNKIGIFDSYKELGKNINQQYKKVYEGDLAYNPYRINVGSIGLKTSSSKFSYISPAYVVFACDTKKLLSEYVFLLFKTNKFNEIINQNTTGSVRQNLKFSTLSEIKIPLPSLEIQNIIVQQYQQRTHDAEIADQQAQDLTQQIEDYLMDELGIQIQEQQEKRPGLQFVNFSEVDRWDLFRNLSSSKSNKYKNSFFKEIVLEKPMYGANVSGVKKKSETRYIRITDINEDGGLNNEFVSPESVDEKYLLQKNDFLIARSGNTVGKTFLYETKYGRAIFAGYLVKYILDTAKILPKYLLFYTKSRNYKNRINGNQRIAGQPNINGQEYLFSPIILPPLPIQERIVAHISDLKSQINTLTRTAQELRQQAQDEFEAKIFSE